MINNYLQQIFSSFTKEDTDYENEIDEVNIRSCWRRLANKGHGGIIDQGMKV